MSTGWAAMPNDWVRDPDITHQAKMVYLVLSSHIGGVGGSYILLIETIVAESGCSRSAVKRALAELETRQMVSVERRKEGRLNLPNVYRLTTPSVTVSDRGSVLGGPTSVLGGPRVGPGWTGEEEPSLEEQELKDSCSSKSDERPTEPTNPRKSPHRFDEFWAVYPRKAGKIAAEKAWLAALKRAGSPEVLIEGADRYGRDPNLPEEPFIPHASRWLNAGRWGDGPEPARAPARPAAPEYVPLSQQRTEW